MLLATLRDLARTLQCRPDQAEDVVRSEPSARAALSRRGLFKAAGAVAAGTLFSQAQLGPIGYYAGLNAWLPIAADGVAFFGTDRWPAPGQVTQVISAARPLIITGIDFLRGCITVSEVPGLG